MGQPKPFWFRVARIIKIRDKAKQKVEAAFKLNHPPDAIYYLEGLGELYNSELQLNAVAYSFDFTREELLEWCVKREQKIKELEKKQSKV